MQKRCPFSDSDWRTVDLPHDWSVEGVPDAKNPTGSGGGFFPAGVGWYRKTFTAPLSWKGKQVTVEFDGVAAERDRLSERQKTRDSSLRIHQLPL